MHPFLINDQLLMNLSNTMYEITKILCNHLHHIKRHIKPNILASNSIIHSPLKHNENLIQKKKKKKKKCTK